MENMKDKDAEQKTEQGIIVAGNEKKKKKESGKVKLKERRFIKKYLECGNATEAYYKMYKVTRKSASTLGYELLKKLDFDLILEEAGITEEIVARKLQEGLYATRPYGKDANIHEDYATRHQYLTTILKLKRRLDQAENDKQPVMQGLQIIINK